MVFRNNDEMNWSVKKDKVLKLESILTLRMAQLYIL
jgi:hypothetical protein